MAEAAAAGGCPLPYRVRMAAVVDGGRTVLIGSGSVLDGGGPDLVGLSMSTLAEQFSFTITRAMALNYPWAAPGVAVAPDQRHALLYNQYLSLTPCTPVTQLRLRDVVKAENVHPEPFAISPDGTCALVMVHSYMDGALSGLAVFDLRSGKALRKIMRGEGEGPEEVCNGCFLSDREVCLWLRGGALSVTPVRGGGKRFRLETGLSPTPGDDVPTNLAMVSFDQGRRLLLSGRDGMAIVDLQARSVLMQDALRRGNAVLVPGHHAVLYQANSTTLQYPGACECCGPAWRIVVKAVEMDTWRVVGEFVTPEAYEMILVGTDETSLVAFTYDRLNVIRLDWNTLQPPQGGQSQPSRAEP